MKSSAAWIVGVIRYNLKIMFANKFIYFLLAAAAFFLLVVFLSLFDSNTSLNEAIIYYWLLIPGILLIFYPTVFGLQNDADAFMLEILFAVPNYRYKIWLIRLILIYLVVFLMLGILALISAFSLVSFSVGKMVYELMFPVFFLGSLAFFISSAVRNGYGAAALMIMIGIFFWISSGILAESKWNLFLNPFHTPENVSDFVWHDVMIKNRIYQSVGIVISILLGLLNLQKREKFI